MNERVDRILFRAACLGSAILLSSSFLHAHEQKTALTDIFFNERTGHLEVAHRFSIHDAEHTLRKATELREDLVRSGGAQESFAEYVANRFSLKAGDGRPLRLALVGQELDGGYLWVYQEVPLSDLAATSFFVLNTILHDVVEGQRNTVNVRNRARVSTLVFEAGAGEKFYEAPVARALTGP